MPKIFEKQTSILQGTYFVTVNTIYESGGAGSSAKLTDLYIIVNGVYNARCYTGGGGSATNVSSVIGVLDNPKIGISITLANFESSDVHISGDIFLIGIN